ncbi:MAG: hypothetical protein HPY50_21260 [Firmicutes bacterium]|nr:hypothetical protein [Bacillota bacterium]
MKKIDKILVFLLIMIVLTGVAVYFAAGSASTAPTLQSDSGARQLGGPGRHQSEGYGRPNRLPIHPTGSLCQILGIVVILVYPFNLLVKYAAGRESSGSGLKKVRRWFLNIHPYVSIVAVSVAVLHMSYTLFGGQTWRSEQWTGFVALLLAMLIGLSGLSKFYKTGKTFAAFERGFHKWGTFAVVGILLLHT